MIVMIAGLAALALAIAGLSYALINRDNDGGDGGNGANSSDGATTGGGTTGGNGDAGNGGGGTDGGSTTGGSGTSGSTDGGSTTGGGGGGTTPAPSQSVRVTVSGSHTDYTGVCPPPQAGAPTFTATFTVGVVPVDVEYRWVTETGEVSDPGWKTLSFPAGSGRTKQNTVVLTTYDASGKYENEIGVEVRSPKETKSNQVPFSVTCETEAPTGGTSDSGSPQALAPNGALRPRS